MIAQELEVSLHMAFVGARQDRHEFVTVEHLLLCLLDNPSAAEVLKACAANIDDLRKSLTTFIKENITVYEEGSKKLPLIPLYEGHVEVVDPQPTLGFRRVIQRAIGHVKSTGSSKKEVTGSDVLYVIFRERGSHAVRLLNQQCVTEAKVLHFTAWGTTLAFATSLGVGREEVKKALGAATLFRVEITIIPPLGASPDSTQRIVEILQKMLYLPSHVSTVKVSVGQGD